MHQYTIPLYSTINNNRKNLCEHKTNVLIHTGIKDGKIRKQCMECGNIKAYTHIDNKVTMNHPVYINSIYTKPYKSSTYPSIMDKGKNRKKLRQKKKSIQTTHCIICGIDNTHHVGMSHSFQTSNVVGFN